MARNLFDNTVAAARVAGAAKQDKPQAKTWINLGLTIDVPDAEGNMVPTFLSLPVGIPLDTTEPMKAGNSEAWNQQVQVRNMILAKLQAAAEELEAGTGEVIEGLQVQLFKRKEKTETDPNKNPLLEQIGNLKF